MKKLLVIVLPIVAIVFVFAAVIRTHPPMESEKPMAERWEESQAQKIDDDYQRSLTAFKITLEKRAEFEAWLEKKESLKTSEEKKAHNKALRDILTEQQIGDYKRLGTDRSVAKKQLKEAKDRRLMNLAGGQQDYERHQADSKKIREQKAARREAAAAEATQ
jgi:hypothetical protein